MIYLCLAQHFLSYRWTFVKLLSLHSIPLHFSQPFCKLQDRFKLRAFRFQVGLRNLETMTDHKDMTLLLRALVDQWKPQFNTTTFHQYFPFADQFIIIMPTMLRNVAICMACMALVALLFIPSIPCAVLVTLAILSINLGTDTKRFFLSSLSICNSFSHWHSLAVIVK